MSYRRTLTHPVLGGDLMDEGEVLGFGYVRSADPKSSCDRLLLAGDEDLAEPPARAMPHNAESVRVLAAAPADRLRDDQVHLAGELDAQLPAAVSEALALPDSPWGAVAWPLIEEVIDSRHFIWLTGGFTRDMLGGTAADINDLDLTGTMPPGGFTELTKRVRRRTGLEFRPKVSADSLVCSAKPSDGGERLYEYRTLNRDGFRFPANGSDLDADALCRDFTVNSLYYDPMDHLVIDATGRGLADLAARPRRLVSLNRTEDAAEQAYLVLRAVKFSMRWGRTIGVEVNELKACLTGFPADLRAELSPSARDRLIQAHGRTFAGNSVARQREATEMLGPVAVALFEHLLEVRS